MKSRATLRGGLRVAFPFVVIPACASAHPTRMEAAGALAASPPNQVALASAVAAANASTDVPHGGMLRYPDVSASSIVFVYADDLWTVPREGGVATPLASPPGVEVLPRFSADGKTIAFVGNYDGNKDLYTIPTAGGVPQRVTHHPSTESLCDWTPDGRLLFFTNGFAGRDRQVQLFTVAATGGLPEPLPVPYGAFASISPDGRWLAYTPHTIDTRTWKRYRGGMSTDIWLFDLSTKAAKRATEWEGTDTAPMWHGNQVYYLSDDGPSHRLNLWTLDPSTLKRKQLTQYADYDVKWPAMGPGSNGGGEIVFQHGASLELYDIAANKAHAVTVDIPGAREGLRPRAVDAAKFIASWELSPSGKRALVGARGDVWSLPAKEGSPRNLTHTSGVAERDPAWSPDGKTIAWLSDATGEYEVWSAPADGSSEPKQLSKSGGKFKRMYGWSPDSKWIAYSDNTGTYFLQPADGGATRTIEKDAWSGDLLPAPSFSSDSRWLAYASADAVSGAGRVTIYSIDSSEKHVVTSGMFDDGMPTFDREGDLLYFRRRSHFQPLYGELDTTFLYAGTEELYVVPLRADQKSPLAAKSDEEGDDDDADAKKGDDAKKDDAKDVAAKDETKDAKKEDKEPPKKVEIAFDGFERRAVRVPVDPGVFGGLAIAEKGELVYLRTAIQGTDDDTELQMIDLSSDEREEKTIAKDLHGFSTSADGKKLLVLNDDGPSIGKIEPGAKLEKVPTAGMEAWIDPRAEWKEIFDDAWRMYRDFFYDPGMHQVDWSATKRQYEAMLADCASREDVSYVIKEMISELNVGHAYYSGGDVGPEPRRTVGMLGCDFELADGAYRIAKVHEGAAWDADARGPLSQPGVGVKAGDYLLAVNGVPIDVAKDPWAAFQGLAEKTITLTVSSKPQRDASARTVVVEAVASETPLRYRSWIEQHRKYVEDKTNGRVGYVYVPSTGVDGQNDLVRQMQGQARKDALIIDERWNSGGQIPTRFIELLNRPITNYWARRDGHDWPWPPDAAPGAKCMLINGLSGSGGDAFPFYFRQAKLGKLIGTRTWGGLVGLSGYPSLIDGGDVEVPSFAFYEKDGTWGIEGHGVDPDVEVIDDPSKMQNGADPQLDRAIAEMLDELKTKPYAPPNRPAYPDRRGMGIAPSDK